MIHLKKATEFWKYISVFEVWLFCTVSNCYVELNDGKVKRVVCKPRRGNNECED